MEDSSTPLESWSAVAGRCRRSTELFSGLCRPLWRVLALFIGLAAYGSALGRSPSPAPVTPASEPQDKKKQSPPRRAGKKTAPPESAPANASPPGPQPASTLPPRDPLSAEDRNLLEHLEMLLLYEIIRDLRLFDDTTANAGHAGGEKSGD